MGFESTAARYVPGGGAAWRDPWPAYAALRDNDPVHHVVPAGRPDHDFFVLSRHADVLAAAVDAATFSSARGLTVEYDELDRIGLADNPPMVMTDPPVHTAFRRLVARGFTPRQVAELEPVVRAFVVERLERLRATGGGDIVAELFKPLPSLVVAHYLGVPEPDRERFDEWSNTIIAVDSGAPSEIADAAGATVELMAYFTSLMERRRSEQAAGAMRSDTISHLVAALDPQDGEAGSDAMAVLGFVFTMVTGGNETTTGLLGGALELLVDHPDQHEELVETPSLVPVAVEEMLRLTSPVQALARTTTRDVELHDTLVPAGRRVLLHYAAANRDWRKYGADAEHLDIRRRPGQVLTFSQGHHHCLGAAAARLQARVTLEEILDRVPHLTLDPDAIEWAPATYVRRPLTMPVSID
ncbi:cytochrome P450 [Nocardioides stalactiti]|uniref:cytochrome P450 n=1 Tax=Nocardioides stalactiti TaxID=2755356 RepID=UPI00160206E7|nr:cytochrome P450 [Nocardioides stalactiti]